MKIEYVFLIVLVLIVVYFMYSRRVNGSENFDTYDNHIDFAKTVYKTDPVIKSKYYWSLRDKDGYQLYDAMYEENIHKNENIEQLGPWTFGRDDDTFSKDFKMGEDSYTHVYNINDMKDPNPRTFEFQGNILTMSQNNY